MSAARFEADAGPTYGPTMAHGLVNMYRVQPVGAGGLPLALRFSEGWALCSGGQRLLLDVMLNYKRNVRE